MVPLSFDQVRRFVGGRLDWLVTPSGSAPSVQRVVTDSRGATDGDLFVALGGTRHDGHAFVADACERGAVGAIVRADWAEARGLRPGARFALVRVPETLRAYGQLAAGYRRTRSIQVVAVTGSNGKTTTKAFIASVLAMRYRVRQSIASYNNEVGVPATLLSAAAADEAVVVEMGARQPGDLTYVCEIAQPTAGVITNIGRAHLETLGSLEGVMRAKRELVEALGASGVAILPWDDPYYAPLRAAALCRSVSFGFETGAEMRGRELALTSDARPSFSLGAERLTLRTPGAHNARNALGALALGTTFGVPLDAMRTALEAVRPEGMRLEEREVDGLRLLVDCYNANPDSAAAALDVLAASSVADGARRLALLGEMHEVGAGTEDSHEELGRRAAEAGVAELVGVGVWAEAVVRGAVAAGLPMSRAHFCASNAEAAALVETLSRPGDLVLIKGSRAARMEAVVNALAGGMGAARSSEGGSSPLHARAGAVV